MTFERDPVSTVFDSGARDLLARAYETPGRWVTTRVADPEPRHLARFAAMGINVLGHDNAATLSGEHADARSRWMRGFVRAVFYQHRWYFARGRPVPGKRNAPNPRALQVEVGGRVRRLGVIPAGRSVRVRLRPGGQAADGAVGAMPASRRIFTDDGSPAARWADAQGRDWLAGWWRLQSLLPRRDGQARAGEIPGQLV